MSASLRKSISDLTRRKARAFFTVLTLALAVASVGMFAVPQLMERSMEREVEAHLLPDATVSMEPLRLDEGRLAALEGLPNVTAVEPRSQFVTRVWVGERRERAIVIGVPDYADQRADVISIDSGTVPGAASVLTDQNNVKRKGFEAGVGDLARVLAADGTTNEFEISGIGRKVTAGEDDPTNDWITLYATPQTVAELSGIPGYSTLGFRLDDNSRPAAEQTLVAVRDELRASTEFTAFADLPVIQEPGTYPGKEDFESLASLLNVITLLALLSALVLVSNTMTTMIGEQTGEIAAMKAIGARRRDIRRMYLRTALLFGVLGGAFGAVLGIGLANLVVGFFGSLFFGIDAGFAVSVPILIACLLLGLVGPPLAALPAIRRAARLPLNEALQVSGSAVGGQGRLDAALRRVRFVPRSAQIGLRGLGRRKRRSFATGLQISLAVATLLALLSVGAGVGQTTRAWFDDNHFDIWVQGLAGKQLGSDAAAVIESTDGVAEAQAWLQNDVELSGEEIQAWGLPADPLTDVGISDGRWYSAEELASGAKVAVLGPTTAKRVDEGVGDSVRIESSSGPVTAEVIGISENQANNGDVVFTPLTTLQAALGNPGFVNSYWVTTISDDEGLIDRTTTAIEDALVADRNQISTLVNYDAKEEQVAANAQITTSITVLGMLIVAISMVALVNAMTMAVLERTREIGMLRSVGAHARDVRGIFLTEGIVVAFAGWLLGIPLGYLFAQTMNWAAGEAVGLSIDFVFPISYLLIALVGTLLLALLVMLAPLRRAVRFKPGEALRHA